MTEPAMFGRIETNRTRVIAQQRPHMIFLLISGLTIYMNIFKGFASSNLPFGSGRFGE